MRIERTVCDVRDCGREALYRIDHFTILRSSSNPGYLLHIDLCPEHAEVFFMKGTGAWVSGDVIVEPSRL